MNPTLLVSSGTAQLANCISLKQTPSVWIRNQLGNEWECMFHMFSPSILPKLNIYNIVLKEGNYAGATVFITLGNFLSCRPTKVVNCF